jgi:hypothetical protein
MFVSKAKDLLGINARNSLYLSRSSNKAKAIVHSKYATKFYSKIIKLPPQKSMGFKPLMKTSWILTGKVWKKNL